MKKNLIVTLIGSLLFVFVSGGCSDKQPEQSASQTELKFSIDSATINSLKAGQAITYQQLRGMNIVYADHEVADDLRYMLNTFCRIDSLKQSGAYESYVENLEPGMPQDASAAMVADPSFQSASLKVWLLKVSSYDACPFYSGVFVIGNFSQHNQTVLIPLGVIYQAGDPPSFMNKLLTSEIQNSRVLIHSRITSDEDDESPGNETETLSVQIDLNDKNLSIEELSRNNSETRGN